MVPIVQVIRLVRVVQVVRWSGGKSGHWSLVTGHWSLVSLDDMLSENIWFSFSKS